MSECISVNKRVYFKEEIMIFDLDRYIDEPFVYFDDKKKIDDQKMFLLVSDTHSSSKTQLIFFCMYKLCKLCK